MANNIPENLEQDMQQLISEVTGRSLEELRPGANFWQDLGIDSIKAIEITVAIERRYKVSIRDEQISQIGTIEQAIKAVKEGLRRKQNEK